MLDPEECTSQLFAGRSLGCLPQVLLVNISIKTRLLLHMQDPSPHLNFYMDLIEQYCMDNDCTLVNVSAYSRPSSGSCVLHHKEHFT